MILIPFDPEHLIKYLIFEKNYPKKHDIWRRIVGMIRKHLSSVKIHD